MNHFSAMFYDVLKFSQYLMILMAPTFTTVRQMYNLAKVSQSLVPLYIFFKYFALALAFSLTSQAPIN